MARIRLSSLPSPKRLLDVAGAFGCSCRIQSTGPSPLGRPHETKTRRGHTRSWNVHTRRHLRAQGEHLCKFRCPSNLVLLQGREQNSRQKAS